MTLLNLGRTRKYPEFPKVRAFLYPNISKAKKRFYRFGLRWCRYDQDRGDSLMASSIEDQYESKRAVIHVLRNQIGFMGDIVEQDGLNIRKVA